MAAGARRLKAEDVPVMHLQWLLPNRSQMRQAWYRCREFMQGGKTAVAINEQYAHTLPERYVADSADPCRRGSTMSRYPARRSTRSLRGRRQKSCDGSTSAAWRSSSRSKSGRCRCCGRSSATAPGRNPQARSFVSAVPIRPGANARAARSERGEAPNHPVSQPSLTVLTLPILPAPRRVYHSIRGAVRSVVKPGVPVPRPSPYPGHYALVRSVVEGLRSIGADFTFNPRTFGDLARVVYAPANEALRQAIELKRRGIVDYVVAGPVNALFADESGGILLSPEIDLVIVPSEWTVDFYEGFPELVAKSRVCPCGVDAEVWKPSRRGERTQRGGLLEERRRTLLRSRRSDREAMRARAAADPVTARRARHLHAV